jgi:hypothetical protein
LNGQWIGGPAEYKGWLPPGNPADRNGSAACAVASS